MRCPWFRFAAAALVLAVPAWCGAQNVYPDPGFEKTGEAGTVRTGQRAGHLAVAAPSHWNAIGGAVAVEPFARYRVTEWVKARVGSGTFFAPYCYEWDSYEWAFVVQNPVRTTQEWTQVQAEFISPRATMYVHPLAYIDAANGEAWVDDIDVRKVGEPAATMREIAAKASPSEDEKRLLARWYVRSGQMRAAEAVMKSADGLTRADIATVLALATKAPAKRRAYLVEVVAYGGPSYNDGLKRLEEMTRGIPLGARLSACTEGVKRNPGLDRAGRSFRLAVEGWIPPATAPGTVRDRVNRLEPLRAAVQQALSAVPSGTPAGREIGGAMERIQQESARLETLRRDLGQCVVRIGGKAVTPETHAIVVPDKPTPQESYAARELQSHLELVTGKVLPILSESKVGKATPLYVGRCGTARPASLQVNTDGLGTEGMVIRTAGPALVLTGNRRGVLCAVYSFLEDQIGCRWFTPDCATWPKTGTIDVGRLDRRYTPPLEYRAGDYPVSKPGEFAVRSRMNGRVTTPTEEQGGWLGVHNLAHTFAALVPPEKYFNEHPEYFSLVGGKRQSGYAQLCLTNPDVLRITIEGVRRWIKENPTQSVFSVSQNDTGNWCECPKCTAVAEEEGSQSGPMVRFVNAVADAIKKDHPNIAIETLAYQYTRKPPKLTKPRPNVIICLCSIECCFIHPLETDSFNKSFVDDIRGWNKICNRLWIWDYIINYAHSVCPFPNLYVLKPNIEFFLNNGVKGIYEESCYYTRGSELQELRNYIIAKTLWDPNYDTDKAIDEFCAAYYGPAGPAVRKYVDLIHQDTRDVPNLHVQIYTHPRQYVTPKMVAEAKTLFDQAEAAVKEDPVRLHRVQVARLPILYAEITLAKSGAWTEQGSALSQSGGSDVTALAQEFERIARAEGLTMIREGGPDANLDAWLQSIPRRPAKVGIERLKNDALQVDVLPEMGGRLWRVRLGADGRDLLTLSGSVGAWNPAEGGYEEYSESGYHAPGWQEPYTVKERTPRSVTLEAALANGLRLTRQVEVDASAPRVTVRSTVRNDGSAAHAACLRVHPEFQVSSLADASVRVRKADGGWETLSLANPADPSAEKDTWLRDKEVPAGEWVLVDGKTGTQIADRFQPGQVAQCLLNRSGAQRRVNLELFSPERTLAPGESMSLEHSYEVTQERGR